MGKISAEEWAAKGNLGRASELVARSTTAGLKVSPMVWNQAAPVILPLQQAVVELIEEFKAMKGGSNG